MYAWVCAGRWVGRLVDKRRSVYRYGIWGYGDTEIGNWGVWEWEWEWITEMPEGGGNEEKGSRRTCLTTMRRTKGRRKEGRRNKGRKTQEREELGRKEEEGFVGGKEGRKEGKGIRVFSF